MNIKDLVVDTAVIGLSAALLWHLSNIWLWGEYLIREPNVATMSLETVGLLLALAIGVGKYISELEGKKR